MQDNEYKVSYIYHSGFMVEFEECYLIFDYYKGEIPKLDENKVVFVFASHAHRDHYNPEIFDILKERNVKKITAILAKDIKERAYPEGVEVIKARIHEEYELMDKLKVYTLQSTDAGVAYLIEGDNVRIFHAGDFNDWVWDEAGEKANKQMTGNFRHEIQVLKERLNGHRIDEAFFPLDPRQGASYYRGMEYFLSNIDTRRMYPMHYWGKYEIIDEFIKNFPQYRDIVVKKCK